MTAPPDGAILALVEDNLLDLVDTATRKIAADAAVVLKRPTEGAPASERG